VLLRYPDFSKPFDIFTDASDYQLGAVIAQESWPIAFYSRKLNPAKRNYTTWRRNFSPLLRLPNTKDIFFLVDTANFIVIIRTLDFKTSSQNVSVGCVPLWKNFNITSNTLERQLYKQLKTIFKNQSGITLKK
jgi:hypothetical protein